MAVLIGTTNTAGGGTTFFFDAAASVTRRQAVASGTAQTMSMFVRVSASGMFVKLGIWADSAGAPGALLGLTDQLTGLGAEATLTANLAATVAITSGTYYWLGFVASGATFNTTLVADAPAGYRGRNLTAGTTTAPDPFGSPDFNNSTDGGLAVQVDGTLSGGVLSPSRISGPSYAAIRAANI